MTNTSVSVNFHYKIARNRVYLFRLYYKICGRICDLSLSPSSSFRLEFRAFMISSKFSLIAFNFCCDWSYVSPLIILKYTVSVRRGIRIQTLLMDLSISVSLNLIICCNLADAETFPHLHLITAMTHQMKWRLNDLLAEIETPRACSQRVRACSACSCSNSALFPYGGQECRHVSPHPSGRRWNRPQRSGVREREKGQDSYLIHHSSCRVGLLTPAQIYTPAILYDCLYGLLFIVIRQ